MRFVKIAGICGAVSLLVISGSILLAVSISPWFSWSNNALSDLGATPGSDLLFNLGLVSSGVLAMVFALGLWKTLHGKIGSLSSVLMFADAVSLFAIGLFSENFGDIHFWVSAAFFALFPLFAFTFAAYLFMQKSRKFALASVVIGVLVAAPWGFSWGGLAIPETISGVVAFVWVAILGIRIYVGGPGQARKTSK